MNRPKLEDYMMTVEGMRCFANDFNACCDELEKDLGVTILELIKYKIIIEKFKNALNEMGYDDLSNVLENLLNEVFK